MYALGSRSLSCFLLSLLVASALVDVAKGAAMNQPSYGYYQTTPAP